MHSINIHSIIHSSEVEGPGKRFVIWVQGCSIQCPGCSNKPTWDSKEGKRIEVDELYQMIPGNKEIEGITLLGGEPMEQAESLVELVKKVKEDNFGILTFTGYPVEWILNQGTSSQKELVQLTDLLIDGPYQKDQFTTELPWVGSYNQRYIFLTDRYCSYPLEQYHNGLELRIDSQNQAITFNGLEDTRVIRKIVDKLRKRGILEKTLKSKREG